MSKRKGSNKKRKPKAKARRKARAHARPVRAEPATEEVPDEPTESDPTAQARATGSEV